jgi:hypothetical protein
MEDPLRRELMENEQAEGGVENQLWFQDAKATKAACPELEVLGPPVIAETYVEQFLQCMLDREKLIPECEGTVLYFKVSESIVKVTIERLTNERHAPFGELDLHRAFDALATASAAFQKHLKNPTEE